MTDDLDSNLAEMGWDEWREKELHEASGEDSVPARVIRGEKGLFLLRAASGEGLGRLTGAFEYRAAGPHDLPVVGDWVAVRSVNDPSAPFRIERILPRRSMISRKQAGDEAVEQPLASNVDLGIIVFSLEGGRKCSPRAAERYATMIWGSGAVPLVVLNKADLADAPELLAGEIEAVVPGVEVLLLSCVSGMGVDELRSRLRPGKTAVLLGPSGVGKSTLINLLAGEARQAVGEVRASDLKGRHTTTHRELVVLRDGGFVIDTPGLRELQLWAEESDLDESFSDVAAIADRCRFRDCTHSGEPGCAVTTALAEGTLAPERFAAYLELSREIAYLNRRKNDRLRREERDRWKRINRQTRDFSKERRSRGQWGAT